MSTSNIAKLNDFGQAPWYDNITRAMVREGGLERLIRDDGIRGVTSNPTIFEKAIAGGEGYDEAIAEAKRAGDSIEATFWDLAVDDIGRGADLLRPVHDSLGGKDGFISIEVSPKLAHDTDASAEQAKRAVRPARPPERDDQDPGDARGPPGDHPHHRCRHQRERHADLRPRALRRGHRRVHERARAARGRGWRSVHGALGRVVLREPSRHRGRPSPPRGFAVARQGCRREREAGVRAVPGVARHRPRGGRSRRRARPCSARCGRRRRPRTTRTPPRCTSTPSSGPTP